MNTTRPLRVDAHEHLRLRDEWTTGHRVVVRDRDDGLPGVTLAVVETCFDYLAADLDPEDISSLIGALTRLLDRHLVADCPWCDSLGLVDGDDGIEFCQHPVACDAG